jgi:hypothetical protein
MLPYKRLLVASAARTATGNSGALTIPVDIDAAAIVLDVTAASGTSPTMDVALQTSPDNGTTWYTFSRFAQNTGAVTLAKRFNFNVGSGEAAAVFTVADTGGVLESNFPITEDLRVLWTIGGTNPSFTFVVWMFAKRLIL